MSILERQTGIYRLFGYLTIFRVLNDIDYLIHEKDEINKVIESKKDKKISLNFVRNNNVKNIEEEIAFKRKYIEELKTNFESYGVNISDYSKGNVENDVSFVFLNSFKFEKFVFLLQTITCPLYYSFKDKKKIYKEEQFDFSLSNICSILGFDTSYYKKVCDIISESSKIIGFGNTFDFSSTLKDDPKNIKTFSPLSTIMFNSETILFSARDGEYSNNDELGLLNLITLYFYHDDKFSEMLNDFSLKIYDSKIEKLELNCVNFLILIKFLFNEYNSIDNLTETIIKIFISNKKDYEESILLQKSIEENKKIFLKKLDALYSLEKSIYEIIAL